MSTFFNDVAISSVTANTYNCQVGVSTLGAASTATLTVYNATTASTVAGLTVGLPGRGTFAWGVTAGDSSAGWIAPANGTPYYVLLNDGAMQQSSPATTYVAPYSGLAFSSITSAAGGMYLLTLTRTSSATSTAALVITDVTTSTVVAVASTSIGWTAPGTFGYAAYAGSCAQGFVPPVPGHAYVATLTSPVDDGFVESTTALTFGAAPAGVAGCSLWLDSADPAQLLLSANSSVLTWLDKSGNGNAAVAAPAGVAAVGTLPTYAGSTSGVAFSTSAFVSPVTAGSVIESGFIVVTPAVVSGSAINTYLGGASAPLSANYGGRQFRTQGGTVQTNDGGHTNALATASNPALVGGSTVLLAYVNGGASGALVHYENGAPLLGSTTLSTTYLTTYVSSPVTVVGARGGGGNAYTEFLGGALHEVLLFSTALYAAEASTVTAFLMSKWGLA